jgi:hypothetical protein
VHRQVNIMKNAYSEENFIDFCKKIVQVNQQPS